MFACATETQLETLLKGELPDVEAAALRAHIEVCRSCLTKVASVVRRRQGRDAPPRRFTAGDVLDGRFQLLNILGQGAFGTVWEALALESGDMVAIKLLRNPEPEHVQRLLQREARLGLRVKHPAFVPVRDVLSLEGDQPALVMDRLEGRDLSQELDARGTLSVAEAVAMLGPIASALTALHAEKIAHRDLKLGNLFMERCADGSQRVRILDLGMARSLELAQKTLSAQQITKDGTALGTPRYMAPEQLAARSDVGPEADVWALGVIALRLLTGQYHVEASSLGGVAHALRGFQPTSLAARVAHVPGPLAQLVLRSLHLDRKQRPSAQAWEQALC